MVGFFETNVGCDQTLSEIIAAQTYFPIPKTFSYFGYSETMFPVPLK